jgi:hypothetical protein
MGEGVGLALVMLRSQQKSRLLLAETKPLSEKRPQAVFPMDERSSRLFTAREQP